VRERVVSEEDVKRFDTEFLDNLFGGTPRR